MVRTHDHPGSLVPQETDFDNADQPGIAQPFTQDEIDDLLYGTDRSATARLSRLRELREEMAARESGDFGGQDPASMLVEIDRAIEDISAVTVGDEAGDALVGLDAGWDPGEAGRLDTLAPDDVDARDAIEGVREGEGDR